MGKILRLEEVGLFLLSILLFAELGYAWWVFPLVLLLPDLGMIGYALGPSVGAATYNLTHHKALAVILVAVGSLASIPGLTLAGLTMLGHASLDRALGYGLKYPDSFHHTHLGWIGRGGNTRDREAST
jgi:hypothetical protein